MTLESLVSRFKSRIGAAALAAATLAAGVALASRTAHAQPALPTVQGVVSQAANNPGKYGTNWQTTLWASQDTAETAKFTLCAGNKDHPTVASECKSYDVSLGRVITLENVLKEFPNVTPPAALFYSWKGITPDQGVVFSNTSTNAPNGQPGRFGQGVPGILLSSLAPPNMDVVAPLHNRLGFRTNLGLANGASVENPVTVRVRDAKGTLLGERTYTLPPLSWTQLNDIYQTFGVKDQLDGFADVISPVGSVAMYASIVDNASGDPTCMPAMWKRATPENIWVPMVAHLPGYNNTEWVGDVLINNFGRTDSFGDMIFLAENKDNATVPGPRQFVRVHPNAQLNISDALQQLYGITETKGMLQQWVVDSPPMWARVFNNSPNGTFGQEYVGVYDSQTMQFDMVKSFRFLKNILIGLSQSADPNTGSRTNLTLENMSGQPQIFRVELYDDIGKLLGQFEETVPGLSLTQVNKVYGRVTQQEVRNGRAIVTTSNSSEGWKGLVLASIVDNVTGDPLTEYANVLPWQTTGYEMRTTMGYADATGAVRAMGGVTRDIRAIETLLGTKDIDKWIGTDFHNYNNETLENAPALQAMVLRINTLTRRQIEDLLGSIGNWPYTPYIHDALDDADNDGWNIDIGLEYGGRGTITDWPFDDKGPAPGNDPNGAVGKITFEYLKKLQ